MVKEPKELELKYRPLSFDELVGWEKEKESLLSIIHTKRMFLLYGLRGCGKTTVGRLIAYELGIDDFDIIEIDGATNTGVDNARDIKAKAQLLPLKGEKKIYIIDEVHQLSRNAFDSLLKILEEPPEHCVFVICTSEINKVPQTIKSRAAAYEVKPLDRNDSFKLLNWVCEEEKIEISNAIKQAIVAEKEGVPREMLIALDMVKGMSKEADAITLISSTESNPQVVDLCRCLLSADKWSKISKILQDLKEDPESIRYGVLGWMNTVLLKEENARAATVILNFTESFMYSKKAGLTLACYMSIKA